MAYLDELRAYLRQVERRGLPSTPDVGAPDPALVRHVRGRVFEQLRRKEAEEPGWLDTWHEEWTAPGRVEAWTAIVAPELRGGIASTDADLLRGLDLCVARAFDDPSRGPRVQSLDALEITRIAKLAARARGDEASADVRTYAAELGLVRHRAGALAESGRAFLDLVGIDSVAFLLHVESTLSTGVGDPWRLHRSVLATLRARPTLVLPVDMWSENDHLAVPTPEQLQRLAALGVADVVEELPPHGEPAWGWSLLPEGQHILDDVLADPPSAMRLLARAAVDDDLDHVLHAGVSPASARTDATLEVSRVVAHEVRNAIGPVRAAVQRLIRAAGEAVPADRREELGGRIFRGLDRLDSFVADIARFTELGERPVPIDVGGAIEEALAATELERNGHLLVKRQLDEARVVGPRTRFVLALVNLVRNAAQAAGDRTLELRIEVATAVDTVTVAFDDDGPGVSAEHRARIFEAGVSLRGGTGLGLAHVRAVVEEEMGGRVGYNVSERGGARFVLELPRAPEETP